MITFVDQVTLHLRAGNGGDGCGGGGGNGRVGEGCAAGGASVAASRVAWMYKRAGPRRDGQEGGCLLAGGPVRFSLLGTTGSGIAGALPR